MLETLANTPVSELQRQAPVRVPMDAPLLDVVNAMRDNNRSSAIVEGRDGRLLGVFTQNDLVTRVDLDDLNWRHEPVVDYMTRAPITAQAQTSLAEALRRMSEGRFRRLPVVDGQGRATGMVSIRDIIQHVAATVVSAS